MSLLVACSVAELQSTPHFTGSHLTLISLSKMVGQHLGVTMLHIQPNSKLASQVPTILPLTASVISSNRMMLLRSSLNLWAIAISRSTTLPTQRTSYSDTVHSP